ncbi:MAG: DNA polymerase I, partial [Clostridia bacterium]|nr:DNA polymerase I [Clostridia bacterium]
KEYIAKYFESYPKIKDYLHSSIDFAKQNGYVMTITGRRRQIPEIASGNFQLRSFGERAAMNAPLQGSAADIIKIAMINVDAELKKRNMQSKLILQIHDELVLDVVESEVDEIKDILQKQMSDCFNLKVKLEINVSGGKNLYEAK